MRLYNFLVFFTAALLAIICACHLWLVVQDRLHGNRFIFDHRSDATIQGITKHAARVSQWKITELRAIDSQRIYMHDTTGYGDLNARQCCSVESAAKNNPNREIQLFVSRRELNDDQQQKLLDNTNSSLTPWQTVLQHYPNVEVISYDESEYFNDTTLEPWYTEGRWQQSRQPEFYLSEYVRAMSLFRGGGLYLDLDSVLSLKPLTGSKWQNFFVVRRNDRVEYETSTSNQVFHLLHGHHLIDMLILKLVEAGDELQAEPFATALDASLERICNFKDNGLLDPGNNQCVDVRLSEERDVFLQPLDTLFSKRSFSRLKENGGRVNEQSVKQLVKTVVDAQDAVLMTWDSIATILHRNKTFFESPGDISVTGKTLLSTLIAENCPLTAARETNFI